jgi:sigma-E factor negative regulatory protein RseC
MLEEQGIVVEIDDIFAVVRTIRSSGCQQCTANKGCGTASLASVIGQKSNQIRVVNHLAAQVGDQVIIGLEEQALLRTSLALYLLPILGLIIAAGGYEALVHFTQLPHYELLSVLAGFIGFFIGLRWIKHVAAKMSQDARYQPIMIQVC